MPEDMRTPREKYEAGTPVNPFDKNEVYTGHLYRDDITNSKVYISTMMLLRECTL